MSNEKASIIAVQSGNTNPRRKANRGLSVRRDVLRRSRLHAAIEGLEARRLLTCYISTQLPVTVEASVYDTSDTISLTNVTATAINDNGQIVGYGTNLSQGSVSNAFVDASSSSGIAGTGLILPPSEPSQALAVDSSGLVVGQANSSAAFEYDSTASSPDETVQNGAVNSAFYAAGTMTSGGDEFDGGFNQESNGSDHPVLHDATSDPGLDAFIDLTPSASVNSSSFSGAVMGIGKRAVGWIDTGGTKQAAIQAADDSSGPLQVISSLSASGDSEALAISEVGSGSLANNDIVVGYASFSGSSGSQPFYYDIDTNTVSQIPNLPGYTGGEAEAINSSGLIVGKETNGSSSVAFVFNTSTGKIQDLNTLTDVSDADFTESVTNATGINSSGQIVANSGDNAYLLTPVVTGTGFETESNDGSVGITLDSITPLSNGEYLAAGFQGNTANSGGGYGGQFVIYKFNADGTKDTSFGINGRIETGFQGAGYGVTVDSSGNILVTGVQVNEPSAPATEGTDWLVARFNSAGQLDTSFNPSGTIPGVLDLGAAAGLNGNFDLTTTQDGTTTTEVANTPYDIVVSGNRIYLSGTYDPLSDSSANGSESEFALVCLNSQDGSLDTSFNGTGVVKTSFSDGGDHGGRLVIQPNGDIVVAGDAGGALGLARYTPTGQLDSTFNPNGSGFVGVTAAQTADWNVGLALQADGEILVGGQSSSGHFAVARLNSDGTLDNSFGTAGVATANFGGNDDVDELIAQPGGEIVAIGTTQSGTTIQTAIAAFNSDGSIETAFGPNGNGLETIPIAAPVNVSQSDLIRPDLGSAGGALYEAFGAGDSNGTILTGTGDSELNTGNFGQNGGGAAIHPDINTDVTKPTATLDSVTSIPNGVAVEVTYADSVAIDLPTIDSSDISVSGQKTLTVGTPQIVDSSPGTPMVVYDLTDPAGWTASDDGNYTITLNANQVGNVGGGKALATTLGTFSLHAISGSVFNDANGNGVQDPGEAGISGITVFADLNSTGNATGQPSVTTDSSGNYSIPALVSGASYTVREELPAGVVQTAPAGGAGQLVALGSADAAGENFGQQQTSGLSIAGTVFDDLNGNGMQDAGEAGVAGVVVYADVNGSGSPAGQPQYTTDSSGHYNVSGLAANTSYTIRVVLPSGFSQTFPAANAGEQVTLQGASIGSENFGVKGALSIGAFAANPPTVAAGASTTLTATNVVESGTGSITGVNFYLETNGTSGLQIGSDTLVGAGTQSGSTWTISASTSGLIAGSHTYYAVATDSNGNSSAVASTTLTVTAATSGLSATLTSNIPSSVPTGRAFKANTVLTLTNSGSTALKGPVVIKLFLSPDGQLDGGDTQILKLSANVRLNPGAQKQVRLPLSRFPKGVNGSYFLVVQATRSGGSITASSSAAVKIAPPTRDLALVGISVPASLTYEQTTPISFTIANDGNVACSSKVFLTLEGATGIDDTTDTASEDIGIVEIRININPGATETLNSETDLYSVQATFPPTFFPKGVLADYQKNPYDTDNADKTVVEPTSVTLTGAP